MAFEKEEVKVN